MTKYRLYFQKMLDSNLNLFSSFRIIHDNYALNPDLFQEEFNKKGKEVLLTMREWEDKLCRQSEKGGYGVFSGGLADKFWDEIRRNFPEIDNVGLIVNSYGKKSLFSIKKIQLKNH